MNATEIVDVILRGGGELRIDGDQVRIIGPEGLLTAEIVELLRNHKTELISLLSEKDRHNRHETLAVRRMRLDDFAVARLLIPIFSEVVEEKVYFASDNAELKVDENGHYRGCVVYRASELRELVGACAETVWTIHEVKKLFGGNIIP